MKHKREAWACLMGTFKKPTGWRAEIHNGYGTAVWKGRTWADSGAAWTEAQERLQSGAPGAQLVRPSTRNRYSAV